MSESKIYFIKEYLWRFVLIYLLQFVYFISYFIWPNTFQQTTKPYNMDKNMFLIHQKAHANKKQLKYSNEALIA